MFLELFIYLDCMDLTQASSPLERVLKSIDEKFQEIFKEG